MTNVMAEPLPDDIDALKSLLISSQQTLPDTHHALTSLQQENHRLHQLITLY